MFYPVLGSRIEQPDFFAGHRIAPMRVIALETVAHPARQPQILLIICATACHRREMIDFQRPEYIPLRTLTVSAAIPGLLANALV